MRGPKYKLKLAVTKIGVIWFLHSDFTASEFNVLMESCIQSTCSPGGGGGGAQVMGPVLETASPSFAKSDVPVVCRGSVCREGVWSRGLLSPVFALLFLPAALGCPVLGLDRERGLSYHGCNYSQVKNAKFLQLYPPSSAVKVIG